MKISHRQILVILRIIHCLGAFFGSLVFMYKLIIQRNIPYIICYICYIPVTFAVLYLLFARQRRTIRFAYGIFYAMSFVTLLFLLRYIYESLTVVSEMTNELIEHIEGDKVAEGYIIVMVTISKCCSINDGKHTKENFQRFQTKYPDTCGKVEFSNAISCLPFIRNQRNLIMFLCCIMITFRILALTLLWKYIKDEYNDNKDDKMISNGTDGERSTTTFIP